MKQISLAALVLLSLQANATEPTPSPSSCQFYADMQEQTQCADNDYLKSAHKLCQEYLESQPKRSDELQAFLPKIRLCLQEKILKASGPDFCADQLRIAVQSHLECYQEHNYCALSFFSKIHIGWILRAELKEPIWQQTAKRLTRSCSKD